MSGAVVHFQSNPISAWVVFSGNTPASFQTQRATTTGTLGVLCAAVTACVLALKA